MIVRVQNLISAGNLHKVVAIAALLLFPLQAYADNGDAVYVPINRSTLITLAAPASEVVVANPAVLDVRVHNSTHLSFIAKEIGRTNVNILKKDHTLMRAFDVVVGYDLPAIRRALKNFLPEETIGVEMVGNSVALTGKVRSAASVDKALKVAREYVQSPSTGGAPAGQGDGANPIAAVDQAGKSTAPATAGGVLNFLQVITGQQVMLKVRVGEIQRTALKNLGMNVSAGISNGFQFATGAAGLAGLTTTGPGALRYQTDSAGVPLNTQSLLSGTVSKGSNSLSGALQALEENGLFRLLAEPNLVAVSGEQAEFLAGGEIPVPVPQSGSGTTTTVTIQYKPYGVAVRFKPTVLSENDIHMEVEPEVSELDAGNAITVDNFKIPAVTTRRAKTTVELAPGEGFMIAGLLKDQSDATIKQLPGVLDMPILGALFRSSEFQRNETELVIAVTPYITDPIKGSEVKLPTDDFRPATDLEIFFYGALGNLSGKPNNNVPLKGIEGPSGFMVD